MADSWKVGPINPNLGNDDIHLWAANLDEEDFFPYFKHFLSPEERERAQKFNFLLHQRRYVIGRGILRELISRYINTEADRIRIKYSSFGKPFLENKRLSFNLAHCQQWALYGFRLRGDIGVDIECLRPIEDAEGIVKRFFSQSEREFFLSSPRQERVEIFFLIWTLKEAFIKAIGDGLSYPLDAFDILYSDNGTVDIKIRGQKENSRDWTLYSLNAQQSCLAGIAASGSNLQLHKFRLQFP